MAAGGLTNTGSKNKGRSMRQRKCKYGLVPLKNTLLHPREKTLNNKVPREFGGGLDVGLGELQSVRGRRYAV